MADHALMRQADDRLKMATEPVFTQLGMGMSAGITLDQVEHSREIRRWVDVDSHAQIFNEGCQKMGALVAGAQIHFESGGRVKRYMQINNGRPIRRGQ